MKNPSTHSPTSLTVEGLTHDGRGVAKVDGKAVFIDQAIPGDRIEARITRQHSKYDEATLLEITTPSKDRVEPFCPHYQTCGGCQLQHMSVAAQQFWKTENFLTRLTQSVNSENCTIYDPISASDRGYRRRARLGLAVGKKDKLAKLGFRQRESNELVDIDSCPILSAPLNQAIQEHRPSLLEQASRNYKELTLVEADNGVFGLNGPSDSQPFYKLNELKLNFPPDGFIQVNRQVNLQMVEQALDWLELQPEHQVLDLFCGVGNFTLPIAQRAGQVTGIEGLAELVEFASDNAGQNNLENADFHKADLFEDCRSKPWFKKHRYQRILLDPGRQGAFEVCKQLSHLKAEIIVYVSCNAATLIRDIQELQAHGYQLSQACMIDMFPHTTHTEVMVQLRKSKKAKTRKPKRGIFKF